jgi:glycerol-3-phosphate acyltransferase PlsY
MIFAFKWLIVVAAGYLLGNFSAGMTSGRTFGRLDIRKYGSRSTGATNVLRTLGWMPSVLTLLGDALKGLLAALLGLMLLGEWGTYAGGLAAIAGHNWPVFYGFKGGKGIATSLGVILIVEPWFGVAVIVCQFAVLWLTKYMSVASAASAILYSVLTVAFRFGNWAEIAFSLALSAMALYTHRKNFERLKKGEENKTSFSKVKKIDRPESKE